MQSASSNWHSAMEGVDDDDDAILSPSLFPSFLLGPFFPATALPQLPPPKNDIFFEGRFNGAQEEEEEEEAAWEVEEVEEEE